MRRVFTGAAVAVLVLAACGGESPTEIVLVVDSDLAVPDALDEIEITAAGRSGAPVTLVADLTVASTPGLPITLTLYPAVEPPPPLAVVVIGKLADAEVIRRDVTTEFVVGETRMLRVLLAERCLDATCEGAMTCDETGCRPIEIAASELPEWPGQAPVLDGPACTPRDETCNLADDDCDGMTDEGIDVGVDPLHCGECGRACPSGAACTAGLCAGEQAIGIAAGGSHTCAVRADGALACWGWNLHGQLGDGTTADRLVPVDVPGLTGVSAVTAGVAHTCARAGDSVSCFGDNAFGEVGDGSAQPAFTPVRVELADVVDVRAGVSHTCALTSDGAVHCWGDNSLGQLGTGTGLPSLSPAPVGLPTPAAGIAVGFRHACAVLTSGAVGCWGANGNGQIGDGTSMPRPTPVSVMGGIL